MGIMGPEDAGWAGTLREVAERQRAELDLHLPGWPVYGLADSVESGWLAGWSRQDGTVVAVEIGYGLRVDDTWLLVETQPRAGVLFHSLDWVLALRFAADGRDYPVPGALPAASDRELPEAPRSRPVELTVDATPTSAQVQRVDGYVVWRVVLDDVVVTVTGRGISTLPALVRLTDLGSYASRRNEALAALAAVARPEERTLTGPDSTEPLWAHHGLLSMTIADHAERAARLLLNRPFGQLPADWGPRWEAAIRRQRQLRDQGTADARDAVTVMVAQIGDLQERAPWWQRAGLRQRAVNEVVWVTATGEQNVRSAAAQRAWEVHRDGGLDAWQEWADTQPAR
ncbi:hypothetical protein [Micromonospora sp. NBC_01796]|uniref:hypothetical protein n=1 Tax=Micromonospora sp. NBC_01796 TaxID=2975987 RepID=UPI002DDC7598|nr:hypothetical protein [Micromonospora sp. NBC_01796]WSA86233.1 hypothetical protein OIE47_01025 [Micromonospora sp. NBC_01796]